ncbi:mitochondrial carrier protein LEU5 [Apiospora saccharicola]|uniref:Mitochondrial thiamine pyrophosphate carrier 1 n=1 Tax=Apiospora saccharicola TaxID=335842 RepID=A0ABR1W0V1_9PEZI
MANDNDHSTGDESPESRSPIWDVIAGGIAGSAAKTVVAPLDRVRILFQTSHAQFSHHSDHWDGWLRAVREIYQSQGLAGLYKGHLATLARNFPYSGLNFVAYEKYRAAIIGTSPEREAPWHRLLSGGLAGATSTSVTYPLELIRIRLAYETLEKSRASSWAEVSRIIYQGKKGDRGSLLHFYRGFAPTIVGIFPYAGISFGAHGTMQDLFRSPSIARYTTTPSQPESSLDTMELRAWAQLLCGATAGIISQTATYPLEIIRRRVQVADLAGVTNASITDTARRIFIEKGLRGFYVGLSVGYIKIAPMTATSFYVYDRMRRYMGLVE